MDQLRQVVRKVARTQATILIRGEYGTGILRGSKAIPDGAIATRVSIASTQ